MHLLLLTLSNIGDVVLTTPVVELLRERFPDARLDIAGDARSLPLLSATPGLVDCFTKDKTRFSRGALQLLTQLRRRRYDLSIDLRSPLLGHLTRSRRVLSRPWRRGSPSVHAAQAHVDVLRPLLGDLPAPPTRLHLPNGGLERAEQRLAHLPRPRIALAPGANWPPKTWPPERFAQLMSEMSRQAGSWVLLGSPADRAALPALLAVPGAPLHDAMGGTTLLEAAALLACCDVFVGNDSGLGHIAAAVGLPTLTLFGPGQPARYHPWSPRARWLVSATGDIADLDPRQVATGLRELLADAARSGSAEACPGPCREITP
jgi:heptosyltransferase III